MATGDDISRENMGAPRVHTVRDFLVFVRQGMPKVEPLRLLNLDTGPVDVELYTLTDAAMARLALDHLDEVPEDAAVAAVMEDPDHEVRTAYAPMMEFDPPERVDGGLRVTLRHPPTPELTELTVRDLQGRDLRYAANLGLEHPEELRAASVAARAGLDYPSYQRVAFCDHLAITSAASFLDSTTPTG